MTSPVPGLRLLDESRTRDGQGEDLNEDDVWDVAGDGDEEDEDDVLPPFPERDSDDVERSDVDDEPTAEEDDDASGRQGDAVAASPAASSLPRAIAHAPVARRDPTTTRDNAFRFEPEKKPRVAASAPLGRPEARARAGAGRALFGAADAAAAAAEEDDEATYIDPSTGSFREGFVPPHVYATTHSTYSSTSGAGYMEARFNNGQSVPAPFDRPSADVFGSMTSGKGHTLKGRDALKARTAVLRSTGFLERETTPGTPRELGEAPRQAKSPAPISGFDVTPGEVAGARDA